MRNDFTYRRTSSSLLKGIIAILLVLCITFSSVGNVEAATIKLNKKKATLHVGHSIALSLTNGKAVSWRSTNRNIATVTSRGVVTAKKKGKVTIICTASNRKKYKCKITVKNHIYFKKVYAATKKKMGYTSYSCKVCGKSFCSKYSYYNPTEKKVYKDLMSLKNRYSEGYAWPAGSYYAWDAGVFSAGYGCVAFAFMASDKVFGKYNKARKVSGPGWYNTFKVGDIVRINNDSHCVIILEKKKNSVIVVEGAYNNSVHWGREITMDYIKKTGSYYITRYPE